MHIDPSRQILLLHQHTDMGFLLREGDHIPILAALVGFGRPAKIHGFQDIRLSLGIIDVYKRQS